MDIEDEKEKIHEQVDEVSVFAVFIHKKNFPRLGFVPNVLFF